MNGTKLISIFKSIVAPPARDVVFDDHSHLQPHIMASWEYLADRLPGIRKSDLNRAQMAQRLYETHHEGGDKFGRPEGNSWTLWAEWSTSYATWAAAWFTLADRLVRGELV